MSRKYKDFYRIEAVETPEGEKHTVVYKGDYYRFAIQDRARSDLAKKIFWLGILNIGFFAGAGMTNGDYSRNIFMILPYVIQFLPAVLMIIASFSLSRIKGDLTVPQFKLRFLRIRIMAIINIFLAALIFLEVIVFSLTGGGIPGTDDLIFTFLNILMGISYAFILNLHRKINDGVKLLNIT